MNTKKTVFSKIAKGMPKKQVKLSIVQNLITEFDSLEETSSLASYFAYEYGDEIIDAWSDFSSKYNLDDLWVNSSIRMLDEIADTVKPMLEELEQKAEDLGLDPADIYDNYQEARDLVDNADDLYRDMLDKYREIINYVGFRDFS
jgi:hypothetical protein